MGLNTVPGTPLNEVWPSDRNAVREGGPPLHVGRPLETTASRLGS